MVSPLGQAQVNTPQTTTKLPKSPGKESAGQASKTPENPKAATGKENQLQKPLSEDTVAIGKQSPQEVAPQETNKDNGNELKSEEGITQDSEEAKNDEGPKPLTPRTVISAFGLAGIASVFKSPYLSAAATEFVASAPAAIASGVPTLAGSVAAVATIGTASVLSAGIIPAAAAGLGVVGAGIYGVRKLVKKMHRSKPSDTKPQPEQTAEATNSKKQPKTAKASKLGKAAKKPKPKGTQSIKANPDTSNKTSSGDATNTTKKEVPTLPQ
ncbi:MAG: hypothetical protein AAGI66_04220 [Cyanobacteria bacterium P01_H01_bin.74]